MTIRYLLILLLLLPACSESDANPFMGLMSGGVEAGESCVDPDCATFGGLICQNFEGAGYDNSEAWSEITTGGTVNEDDATAPVGRGDQQLKMDLTSPATALQSSQSTGSTFSESEVFIHFKFRFDDLPSADSNMARLYNTSDATCASILLDSTGHPGCYPQGASWPAGWIKTTDAMAADTWYHVWVHWIAASGGSNGTCSLEFTADSTRVPVGSGSKFAGTTTHANTSVIKQWAARMYDAVWSAYYDQVLIKATTIGTVCE